MIYILSLKGCIIESVRLSNLFKVYMCTCFCIHIQVKYLPKVYVVNY